MNQVMDEIKKKIGESIVDILHHEVEEAEIVSKIEVPKDRAKGDFAYPCFHLAKVLKRSPVQIATELAEKVVLDSTFSKVEALNGFLNFYLNNMNAVQQILTHILTEKENFGSTQEGKGKTIVIDYSSPNIAKPFHLGHFRNTVLGSAIYKLYENLGYQVVGINHIGDWGRQFGLLIEGYQRFKDEYDIEKDALHALSDIYTRINQLAKEDDSIMDLARENFKQLEQGNEVYQKLWEYFREISLKEYDRIYEILGSKFDSYNGEAFYNDKMEEVIETLEKKGVLKDSQGAKVVEVGEDMPPCIVLKSNGSTIYATRDLAAILYRVRTYDFTKAIYITGTEQILHFKQVFEVAKYLVDKKYTDGLVHIAYGMIRLKTGKMSTREGNVIYIDELLQEAIQKALHIIEEKNALLENVQEVAKQVGVGALTFNYLKSNKLKDIIFDLDDTLRFDGETGPYIQYTYVRTKSILEKAGFDEQNFDIDKFAFDRLQQEQEIVLVKALDRFSSMLKKAAEEYEPSIVARYLIEIATLFSKFYAECPVIVEDTVLKEARCALVYATSLVIKKGLHILGIECPDKM